MNYGLIQSQVSEKGDLLMKRLYILSFVLSLVFLTLCQPTFALTISPGESLWVQLLQVVNSPPITAPNSFDGMRLQWSAEWDGNTSPKPDLDYILYGPPGYGGGFTEASSQTPSIVDLSIFGGQPVVFEFKNNQPGQDITLPGGLAFEYIFYDNAIPDWIHRNEIQRTAGEVLPSAPAIIGNQFFKHYLPDVNFDNIAGKTYQNSDFRAVPEPATLLLLASGLAVLAGGRRKFKKK